MAAGQQRDQRLLDHLLLTEDHPGHRLAGAVNFVERAVGAGDDGGVEGDGRLIGHLCADSGVGGDWRNRNGARFRVA